MDELMGESLVARTPTAWRMLWAFSQNALALYRGQEMVPATFGKIFEQCRSNRYQGALRLARQQAKPFIAVLGVLHRRCLDRARKYLLDLSASSLIQGKLLDGEGLVPNLPLDSIWLQLYEPQALHYWSEMQIAALYFYLPPGTLMLRRVCRVLRFLRELPTTWRLDVIDPEGHLLLAYQFEVELNVWKIRTGHRCQWNECVEAVLQGGRRVIYPCQQCSSDMDYYARWLTAALRLVASCTVEGSTSAREEGICRINRVGRRWLRSVKYDVELRYVILRSP